MSLNADVKVKVSAALSGASDLSTLLDSLAYEASHALRDGTGSGQVNNIFHDKRSLDGAASEDLDLSGVLKSPLGATLAFTKIKALLVKAAVGNDGNLEIGGAASNALASMFGAATDKLVVPPGGVLLLTAPAAGFAVTAGTGDLLKIANAGAAAATYDIVIIGVAS